MESGVHTNFFFISKVIFETVKSWYGDGEKFNRDWTYTKSYGGPHLAGDKLLVYGMKKLHLYLDTYFSKLNLKTPTLIYHFCHGDFGKSQKYSFFIIKISESKNNLN